MPQELLKALKGPIDNSFGLVSEFITRCPAEIWAEKSGGWPVWQQIYHALSVVDFFCQADNLEPLPALADQEVGRLQKAADFTLSQNDVREFFEKAKAKVDRFAAALQDDDLIKRNEGLYKGANMDMPQAAVLSLLAAHTLYHLGAGDAALRNHGLSGVF